jgi:hypothetical protein
MPMTRLAQYQHCLFRRNSVRTRWSTAITDAPSLKDQITQLRLQWLSGTTDAGSRSSDADDGA